MANSTSTVPQVVEGAGAVRKVNDLFDAGSNALIGGRDASTSALLVFGILGGRINGVDKTNTTVALTASTTNYIVMAKSGLAVSASTATTNWNDSTNYWRLYSVITNTTTFTSYNDERFSPSGIQAPGLAFTGGTMLTAINEAAQVTIASSGTVAIGAAAANTVNITGTTAITAFDTIAAGAQRELVFSGALTLTHNGTSLILPTGANITTQAGDAALFLSLGSGNWKCIKYQRADGTALSGSPFSGGTLSSALNGAPAATVASAATTNIGAAAANNVTVSGTTTITAFDTIADGARRQVTFSGILTLTHNGTSLILPTAANITTAAGDVAEFVSLGAGNWRCVTYLRANGQPLAGAASGMTVTPQSAAYTMVLGDANGTIYHPTTDTTARTWTIPANSSVAYPVGTLLTFDNDIGAGAITLAITSDTLVLVGAAGSTGSRTLASGGQATALKVTATRWRLSGVGIS